MIDRKRLALTLATLGLLMLPARAFPADASCSSVDSGKCTVDLKTGIRMAYLETGPADGNVVILLHGLTDTARSWSSAMATLHVSDPSLHIFALDQRGHGGSWKKALEAKGITSPESVWNATPHDADPNAEDWIAKNWDVDPAADPALIKAIVPETANVKMGTWIGATGALLDFDNTSRLAELGVPALVIWGSQDSIFYHDPDQTGIIEALRKAATIHKIPMIWKQYGIDPLPKSGAQETDIGHNVQWDAPDQVAADILSFIRTGKPTPALSRAVITPAGTTIKTEPAGATIISLP